MNRMVLLLCTLFLIVTSVTGQKSKDFNASDPATWPRYTIKGEDFSAIFPSMPEMTTTNEKERSGRHLRTRLDGVQYGIDVFENSKRESLEGFVGEYQTNPTDVSTGRNIVVNGVAGKEFSTSGSPKATVQFFATERRLYRGIALGANTENPVVKQYFSSIILGKKAEDAIKVSEGPGMPLELDTGERIYKGVEVDRKVRLLTKPEPVFPEEARRLGMSSTVVLQAIFSSTAKVTNIKVLTPGHHGLTEVSVTAASQITFVPAMKDGKNVSMYMTLEYNFYL